jgi:hypothetical protein
MLRHRRTLDQPRRETASLELLKSGGKYFWIGDCGDN